jgi:G3E family GTPase
MLDDDEEDDDLPPNLVELDTTDQQQHSNDTAAAAAEDESDEDTAGFRVVPITILSGFLGAGKTTLVQYILNNASHGKRIAVIENEFGGGRDTLSIESLILREGLGKDYIAENLLELIELPNGCVCCTVKDSLVVTIENLLNIKRTSSIDYILIETSGMANPGPIASIFWLDAALQSRIRLDGIVTIVDALHIESQLEDTFEASQQIAYADRILLNKMDLLTNQQADQVERTVRQIHPTALLQRTNFAAVPDLDWILNVQCYDHRHDQAPPDFVSDIDCCHTAFISTMTLYRTSPVALAAVNRWLAEILWPDQDVPVAKESLGDDSMEHISGDTLSQRQSEIYRVKGLVLVQNEGERSPTPHIVQAVHDLWEVYPTKTAISATSEGSKLIVIGRGLDEKAMRKAFEDV